MSAAVALHNSSFKTTGVKLEKIRRPHNPEVESDSSPHYLNNGREKTATRRLMDDAEVFSLGVFVGFACVRKGLGRRRLWLR